MNHKNTLGFCPFLAMSQLSSCVCWYIFHPVLHLSNLSYYSDMRGRLPPSLHTQFPMCMYVQHSDKNHLAISKILVEEQPVLWFTLSISPSSFLCVCLFLWGPIWVSVGKQFRKVRVHKRYRGTNTCVTVFLSLSSF